jgi:uncharacterized membrane protein YqhA
LPRPDLPATRPGAARILSRTRYLALAAVVGLGTTTIATFGLAVVKTVQVLRKLLDGGWNDDLIVVALLEAMDGYLLGVVQLIVAIGLYELFVGPLDVPDWLSARSLDDLKKPIIDVLILFVAIKGIERLLVISDPFDGLLSSASVAVLVVALTAYRVLTARKTASGDR